MSDPKSEKWLSELALWARLGEMMPAILHEIANQLSIIQGVNHRTLKKAESGSLEPEDVQQQALHIVDYINNIKDISRTAQSVFPPPGNTKAIEVSLDDLIDQSLGICQWWMKGRPVSINRCESEANIRLLCQAEKVSLAIIEVVNHCLQAIISSESKLTSSTINLEVTTTESFAVVVVSHTAQPMPPERQKQIFEIAHPAGSVTVSSGLTLFFAKQWIESCGGTLAIDHNSGHNRFVITLPRKVAQDGPQAA